MRNAKKVLRKSNFVVFGAIKIKRYFRIQCVNRNNSILSTNIQNIFLFGFLLSQQYSIVITFILIKRKNLKLTISSINAKETGFVFSHILFSHSVKCELYAYKP